MSTIDVDGIPVAFEVRGTGVPVLAIHGWQGDRRYMQADLEPVFEADGRWRRVYLDLPGHGATPAPVWLSGQSQMVAILRAFVDGVLDGEPFAVAGNSYGGYLTLALVRAMPERLRGAALLVPDLPAQNGTRDLPRHRTIVQAPAAFGDLAEDEAWIPDRLVEQRREAVLEIREHDMPSIRVADQGFLARLDADYLLPTELAVPGLPFERPSLLLTGRQDATTGYGAAYRLLEEFPRATYAVLDLAGHWLGRIERPNAFRALVADWLDRVAIDATN